MPDIEREKVRAILQEAPPEKREALAIRLKERGFKVVDKAAQPEFPSIGQRALKFAKTEGLPIAGGMIGGALGAVAGPAGAVAGAGLGGAAGRSLQTIGEYAFGGRDPLKDTPLGNAAQIGASGVAQAGAELGGQGLGMAANALKPMATTVGGQALKLVPKVAQKYGQAVLNKPKILIQALAQKDVGAAYQAFERYTGLKGLKQLIEERAKSFSPGELESMLLETSNKVKANPNFGIGTSTLAKQEQQELYSASQAVNHLKMQAKYRDPKAASILESGVLNSAKKRVEDAMQAIYSEYGPLRTSQFESKARQAFSHVFPQNLDQTPAALRTLGAVGLAGREALRGEYRPAAALPLMSPAAVGLGIRGAAMASPVVGLGAGIYGRSLMEQKAQQMAQALLQARQQQQP